MQLILDCFKRIFEALAGVYTKAETDSALGLKADATALEAEAQAREQADEALGAKIDANTANDNALANVIKWQTYAAAIQKELDAETAMQFAQEFERATDEYLADPTATKEWYTSSETESTNPYFLENATKPIVDFQVVKASRSAIPVGSFNANTNVPIFLPNVIDVQSAFYLLKVFNSPVVLPSAELFVQTFYGANMLNRPLSFPSATNCRLMLAGATSFNSKLYLPNATNCREMLRGATSFNQSLSLPKATDCYGAFSGSPINNIVSLPSCSNAQNAFNYTKMSTANISATLDSLPTWTDGGSHVITFTGNPGIASTATDETFTVADEDGTEYSLANCPIFDTDDEAQTLRKAFVLAVVKKGWTVEGSVYSNTAATMSLGLDDEMGAGGVPMWYRLTEDEYGEVKDANGVRYILSECGSVFTPQGENLGYTQFPSREACLEAWSLTELTEEEMFPQDFGSEE